MKRFYEVSICGDCLQASANGLDSIEYSFDSSDKFEEFKARFTDNPETQGGADLIPGHRHTIKECGRAVYNGEADCPFEEGSFSWSSCDWCRNQLGGDRYPAVIYYAKRGAA